MDQQKAMDIMSGRRAGPGAALLRAVLAAASLPYAAAMGLRRRMYRWRLLPSRRAGVPVISVGNITAGGTGKTPTVAWVVQQLKDAGRKPAVLTRGYKAVAGRSDEADLLRRLCGVPVIVNADRVAGASAAVAGKADVIVMDDGFQHRRLRRALDVVLIDATNPFGFGWCLPRGLLREPRSALRDAGAVVITRSDALTADDLSRLKKRLGRLAKRAVVCTAVHAPVRLADETGRRFPCDYIRGKKVCAFCGIGNPAGFFATLERLGAQVVARHPLEDHAAYTPELIARLKRAGDEARAEIFATTQKDAVKLDGRRLGRSVWEVWIEIDILEGRDELIEKLRAAAG